MSAAQEDAATHIKNLSLETSDHVFAHPVHYVINQIKRKSSGIALKLDFEDFTGSSSFDSKMYAICKILLQAVSLCNLPLDHLTLSPSSLEQLSSCFAHNQTTSSLKTFRYRPGRDPSDYGHSVSDLSHKTIEKILESATSLHELEIGMMDYPLLPGLANPPANPIPKFLAASRLQDLRTLCLLDTDIAEADLLHTLSRCSDKLTHVELSWMQLTTVSQGCPGVSRSILSKTQVEYLVFTNLEINNDDKAVCFDSLTGEKDSNQDIILNGREQVQAGLQQLLSAPLTLVDLVI